MYPWLWFWAPQIHFPWSGAVSQNIEPRTAWFERHISPDAGSANIEAQITELASYGKQLGMVTEALIGIAKQVEPVDQKTQAAIARLKDLQSSIDSIKAQAHADTAQRLVDEIQELQRRGGREFQEVAAALLPLLSGKRGP